MVLAGALLAGPGCTRRYIVSVDELRKLDGFDETAFKGTSPGGPAVKRRSRTLQTVDGAAVDFTASTELWLVGPQPEVKGRFRQIRLTSTTLDGVLADEDRTLRADLSAIQFARVESVDPFTTGLLAGGTILAGLVGISWLLIANGSFGGPP